MELVDLPEPDLQLDYFHGTSGTYAGYDRFGRIKDQYWKGYGSTSDVDRFKYAYDYAGSRTYRDIDSSIYATNDKDQAYTYDSLDRLITSDQGTLSGTTRSGKPASEEDWTLTAPTTTSTRSPTSPKPPAPVGPRPPTTPRAT